jgi:hypothetical protein
MYHLRESFVRRVLSNCVHFEHIYSFQIPLFSLPFLDSVRTTSSEFSFQCELTDGLRSNGSQNFH